MQFEIGKTYKALHSHDSTLFVLLTVKSRGKKFLTVETENGPQRLMYESDTMDGHEICDGPKGYRLVSAAYGLVEDRV